MTFNLAMDSQDTKAHITREKEKLGFIKTENLCVSKPHFVNTPTTQEQKDTWRKISINIPPKKIHISTWEKILKVMIRERHIRTAIRVTAAGCQTWKAPGPYSLIAKNKN